MRDNKFMNAIGKSGVVFGLFLAIICSATHQDTMSYAETDTYVDPDDEFDEEDSITFKDKQGLTYSTDWTAKTIYDPTSTIEVSIAKEDRDKISGKIVVPANIKYSQTGKSYKVTGGLMGFAYCSKVTSLVLPASWKTVDDYLCMGSENLKSVTLKASSVKMIDVAAFSGCKKLTTIKNIQKAKKIGEQAFCDCTSLKKLNLNQVTCIEDNAFQGCKKLSTINIGKNFKEFGSNVFSNCKKLKTIVVKSTKLKKVSKNALGGTSHKITIKVPKKKLSTYRKLFENKGNKKVVVKAF